MTAICRTVGDMAPLANPIDLDAVDVEHFMSHIEVDEAGCWLWRGWTAAGGYGSYRIERRRAARKYLAHRVSMAIHLGRDLAPGEVVDHDDPERGCSVRICVNPAHLVVTDARGNNATKEGGRYVAALGLECQRGHELTLPGATYPTHGGVGCRQCQRMKQAESRKRLAADPAWRARRAARERERRAARKRAG